MEPCLLFAQNLQFSTTFQLVMIYEPCMILTFLGYDLLILNSNLCLFGDWGRKIFLVQMLQRVFEGITGAWQHKPPTILSVKKNPV